MRWPFWRVAVAERSMEPALHPGDWLFVYRTITRGRPLRVRPGQVVVANLLIYWSGFEVVWKLGVTLVIGYVLIAICMAFDKQRPPLDWKSAIWLPAWLIGLGIISWQGVYDGGAVAPPVNTGNLPFWWDMLIVAVFSVVIYYWAMVTRLPREEMCALVNRQSGVEEPDLPAGH